LSEQDDGKVAVLQRPTTDDRTEWKIYWEQQGQSLRTEPEIDTERQKYLAVRRSIRPDIEQGIYPLKNIDPKLSRADVGWLLATHEDGCGPIDWSDKSQRMRQGIDLRGADLRQQNLKGLPLTQIRGGLTFEESRRSTPEQRHMAAGTAIGHGG
jgi:hypothetical protein